MVDYYYPKFCRHLRCLTLPASRPCQVVQALSPALHAEYLAAKDYPKHLRYEELTKAAIAALNSKVRRGGLAAGPVQSVVPEH